MREYNNKISEKANISLNQRERKVRKQKRILAVCGISIAIVIVILCSSISTFAKSVNEEKPLHKYYTSIRIQPGDTLWDIADEYMENAPVDKTAYIKEVCEMNHLCSADRIQSEQYIVVSYYSTETK